MDEATHEFLTELGHPTSELMEQERISVPLLESNCKFKTPLVFDDEAVVITEVVEIHNKVFKLSHSFYRGDTFIAEGFTLRAWTSFDGKPKAVTIPASTLKNWNTSESQCSHGNELGEGGIPV